MKFRAKATGKVCELLGVAYDKSDAIILMVEIEGRRELLLYKSLAQLQKDLEDYTEDPKPALTEEERIYIIAWLQLLNYASYDSVKRADDGSKLLLMHGKQSVSSIPTFGRFRWWQNGQSFAIKDLELDK